MKCSQCNWFGGHSPTCPVPKQQRIKAAEDDVLKAASRLRNAQVDFATAVEIYQAIKAET